MSIRDRMFPAICAVAVKAGADEDAAGMIADETLAAILAACPEIAALDHAREGWLYKLSAAEVVYLEPLPSGRLTGQPVLVVPKPEAS